MTAQNVNQSGYFAALAYYYGYLNLILEDHRQEMKSQVQSNVAKSGAKVVLPMLIIVPESDQVPKSFDVEDKITTCEYVVTIGHRGGSINRDFKRSVMKLLVDKNDVIYFTGEFPAILLTVYETIKASEMGLSKNQLEEIRTDFCRTLQSLLCHPDHQHCIDQYRLVLWRDSHVDLYDFLLSTVRETVEEGEASSLVVNASRSRGVQLTKSSFSRQESSNTNLRKLSGAGEPYVMRDVSPRGICLIIDITDVTPTTKTNVQQLRTLFTEQFDFEVYDYVEKMTWDQLDTLLCKVAQKDHSRYDAFVCYLRSCGQLGTVCTSDDDEISTSFVTLVNNFIINNNNRKDLLRKPKIFLLHTTDSGTTDNLVSNDSKSQVLYIPVHYVFI